MPTDTIRKTIHANKGKVIAYTGRKHQNLLVLGHQVDTTTYIHTVSTPRGIARCRPQPPMILEYDVEKVSHEYHGIQVPHCSPGYTTREIRTHFEYFEGFEEPTEETVMYETSHLYYPPTFCEKAKMWWDEFKDSYQCRVERARKARNLRRIGRAKRPGFDKYYNALRVQCKSQQ